MGRDQQRRLEELEDGIQRTRAHLSDTLQEVENPMIATHLGTQQGRGEPSAHRPEVVGEATHLGTGQGWSGYVHPG